MSPHKVLFSREILKYIIVVYLIW